MPPRSVPDPATGPSLGASRGRVLDLLRAADGPVGVREVAEATGLHANTARFHLDGLVAAGLAERGPQARGEPGRPRTVYRARAGAPAGRRSYRLLAEMLTGMVSRLAPHPDQAAVEAGRQWGRYLADRPAPVQKVDLADALHRLTAVLDEVGFAPGPVADLGAPVLPLRHCPFQEVASANREVVCSLHLGLMRGVLEEVRAPARVDRLEPFVEPSLCLAHLAPARRRHP